jgi:NodT family efflux transporter outer membrane factor (OMF) lipoprotein
MHRNFGIAVIIVSGLLSVSCSSFRPEAVLDDTMKQLPEHYGTNVVGDVAWDDRWWRAFGDDQLNDLVGQALRANLSLQQAMARLQQARLVAAQQGAARKPSVSLDASATASRQSRDDSATTIESYEFGPVVSYELDLWGRVKASRSAADLEAQATESDRNAAAMTVAAQVTLTYLQLLSEQESLALLQDQVRKNQDLLSLVKVRYGNAQATALDVLQQEEVVSAAEALIPSVQATIRQLSHALAVLLGEMPGKDLELVSKPLVDLPAVPEVGVPLDLLSQRPDVAAARLRLLQAGWRVRVAEADRFPALRLTASAAYSSDEVATLFDDWFARLVGGLTAPLLDGGRRRAEVERTQAVVEERAAVLRQVLLTAMQEVEDALMFETHQRETLAALERQISVSERSYAESLRRYLNGQLSFLAVMTSDLALQRLRRDRVRARYQLVSYRVRLYRALGGDWNALLDESDEMDMIEKERDVL